MPFTRPEKLFEEKNFLKLFTKVTCFRLWAKKRLAGCSNCLYMSSGAVMESCIFWGKWKFFCWFRTLCETFSQHQKKFAGLSIKLSSSPVELFEENVIWMKQFSGFHQVLTVNKKHWVKLSHLLPRCWRECSERKHNFELYTIYFNLAEWFLVEIRTAIYVSRRTFSATFFWKISFLFWFSDFEQKSCKTFHEMLSAICAELTSLCPEEQIEKTSGF